MQWKDEARSEGLKSENMCISIEPVRQLAMRYQKWQWNQGAVLLEGSLFSEPGSYFQKTQAGIQKSQHFELKFLNPKKSMTLRQVKPKISNCGDSRQLLESKGSLLTRREHIFNIWTYEEHMLVLRLYWWCRRNIAIYPKHRLNNSDIMRSKL